MHFGREIRMSCKDAADLEKPGILVMDGRGFAMHDA